jgi:hypothetical protein
MIEVSSTLLDDWTVKPNLQFAHIEEGRRHTNEYDDLVVLCIEHHADFDRRTPLAKRLPPLYVRALKGRLAKRVSQGNLKPCTTHHWLVDGHIVLGLEKENIPTPQFFRATGPYGVDFAHGAALRREEIEHAVRDRGTTAIIGAPASGKTVILRAIANTVLSEGTPATFLELKHLAGLSDAQTRDLVRDVGELEGCLLIDDAHSYPDVVEAVLRACNLRVVVASRPLDLPMYNQRYAALSELLRDAIFVSARDVCDQIVNSHPATGVSGNREILKLFRNDLWNLATAIGALESEGSISATSLRRFVTRTMIHRLATDYGLDSPEDVLLPVATMFAKEVAICRAFLLDELDVDEGVLNRLVATKEIIEQNGMLSLHHSSRAKHIVDALREDRLLAWQIKRRISSTYGNWEDELWHQYVAWRPPNYAEMFRQIRFEHELIESLLKNDDTCKKLFQLVEHERNWSRVFGFYQDLSWTKTPIVSQRCLQFMNPARLGCLLNSEETSLVDLAFCLIAIPWEQDSSVRPWIEQMRKAREREAEEEAVCGGGAVTFCPCSVDWSEGESLDAVLENVAKLQEPIAPDERLVFDAERLRRAILCNWNVYSGRARLCLLSCFAEPEGLGRQRELVEALDIAQIEVKIVDEEDLDAVAFFLRTLLWVHLEVTAGLWRKVRERVYQKLCTAPNLPSTRRLACVVGRIEEQTDGSPDPKAGEDMCAFIRESGWCRP